MHDNDLFETGLTRRNFLKSVGNFVIGLFLYPTISQLSPSESKEEGKPPQPETIFGTEVELKNKIFITIDDCADPKETQAMANILTMAGAKATFFPNTAYLTGQSELWKQIRAAGHDIGYHTTDHTGGLTPIQLVADFKKFETSIQELVAGPRFRIKYVRPPYGNWDQNWNSWARANFLTTVRWNYVPSGKFDLNYFIALRKSELGGGIILLHPRPWDTQWLNDNIAALSHLAAPARLGTFNDVYAQDAVKIATRANS